LRAIRCYRTPFTCDGDYRILPPFTGTVLHLTISLPTHSHLPTTFHSLHFRYSVDTVRAYRYNSTHLNNWFDSVTITYYLRTAFTHLLGRSTHYIRHYRYTYSDSILFWTTLFYVRLTTIHTATYHYAYRLLAVPFTMPIPFYTRFVTILPFYVYHYAPDLPHRPF